MPYVPKQRIYTGKYVHGSTPSPWVLLVKYTTSTIAATGTTVGGGDDTVHLRLHNTHPFIYTLRSTVFQIPMSADRN